MLSSSVGVMRAKESGIRKYGNSGAICSPFLLPYSGSKRQKRRKECYHEHQQQEPRYWEDKGRENLTGGQKLLSPTPHREEYPTLPSSSLETVSRFSLPYASGKKIVSKTSPNALLNSIEESEDAVHRLIEALSTSSWSSSNASEELLENETAS
ncbi:uncharacterized protein TM35_000011030 [Trypanosoma theileri]|uniref:Uncharacterized protein n=1 Tax=Trypanosoma theileri TaxID=67003 RepID=A0A1X0P8F3_9TRYP|nr:uncharacterized protein TM35_000011030 [Trypanosoma theileri]ORC93226.1 hypothetical protein TM35_000011030 [Trypanosoma theileri]